jgi:hypothetical protein
VPDLYWLAYGATARHRPEGHGDVSVRLSHDDHCRLRDQRTRSRRHPPRTRSRFPGSEAGRFAFAVLWTAILLIATVVRARAVLDHHP